VAPRRQACRAQVSVLPRRGQWWSVFFACSPGCFRIDGRELSSLHNLFSRNGQRQTMVSAGRSNAFGPVSRGKLDRRRAPSLLPLEMSTPFPHSPTRGLPGWDPHTRR